MIELLEQRQDELREICRTHEVQSLDLFGSAADGTWNAETSDLDFLLEFLPDKEWRSFGGFFDLKWDLEKLFGRKVDLVMSSAIRNSLFLKSVNEHRTPVYAA